MQIDNCNILRRSVLHDANRTKRTFLRRVVTAKVMHLHAADDRRVDLCANLILLRDIQSYVSGLGYMALGQDLIGLLRCLLVNSTNGPESSSPCHVTLANLSIVSSSPPLFEPPETQLKDKPIERRLYRRSTDLAAIVGIASMVTGGIANGQIGAGIEDQAKGKMTMKLRYISISWVNISHFC